jgi:DNA repair photolyase
VTDNYQPVEAHYKLMPEIWKLLIKYKTSATISTKSDLILRDIELIDQLSRITSVNIALTITTTDQKIQKLIEPNATSSQKRFETLKAFSQTGVSRGVHLMPIIPYLTDSKENIESIYANAKNAKVQYVLPGIMYLRSQSRTMFFSFIKKEYPHLYEKYLKLYQTAGAGTKYKDTFYQMLNMIRMKYQITS